MKKIVCITCPNSCVMDVDEMAAPIAVTGNKCKRGTEFALAELTHPMRTLTCSVATTLPDVPVLSVRTTTEIPKEKIFAARKFLRGIVIDSRVGIGECIVKNILDTGADVIITSNAGA
jgi:CxxC motif-containing protein